MALKKFVLKGSIPDCDVILCIWVYEYESSWNEVFMKNSSKMFVEL